MLLIEVWEVDFCNRDTNDVNNGMENHQVDINKKTVNAIFLFVVDNIFV